jgi:rhodanese-related sulfurtransferase
MLQLQQQQLTILNTNVKVSSLECGALAHGGATQVGNYIFSNVDTGEPIKIGNINSFGIIIPSTIDIDQHIDPREYIDKYKNILSLCFSGIQEIPAKGSWYSDELDRVVVEDNTILAWTTDIDPDTVMNNLLALAGRIKEDMTQEAVSIMVNEGLVIC